MMRSVPHLLLLASTFLAFGGSVAVPAAVLADGAGQGEVVKTISRLYKIEVAGEAWQAEIERTEPPTIATILVRGPGDATRAREVAAGACRDEGGRFDESVAAETLEVLWAGVNRFRFTAGCL